MNIVRYEPWNHFRALRNDLDRVFGDFLPQKAVEGRWAPAVDIKEDPERFVLHADIPGVDPRDIEITMDKNVLTIKGQRRREEDSEDKGYRRVERFYGEFYRHFALPDGVNPEGITAKGVNGVLEVSIPKQEKVQPRRIEVAA